MKINELLTEAKARIEHPEDRVFEGGQGALEALESLKNAASSSENLSVKFDGTPALIAGRDNGKFVMTDKAGLAKKQLPASAVDMYNMIFDRKPDQPGRMDYAASLSGLFKSVEKLFPPKFKGLVQFDVMWFSQPKIDHRHKMVEFQPNKVLYSIPMQSQLGKEIANSRYGIVVHSYFDSPEDEDSRAIQDFESLGLNSVTGLVVLNPRATFEVQADPEIIKTIDQTASYAKKSSKAIDSFVSRDNLAPKKIVDLPALMKRFLAERARVGKGSAADLQTDFITWIKTSSMTESKRKNCLEYIQAHMDGYGAVWAVVSQIVAIKMHIFGNLETLNTSIKASINGHAGHEGYVVDAPSGKIKLVNRPLFMLDKQSEG